MCKHFCSVVFGQLADCEAATAAAVAYLTIFVGVLPLYRWVRPVRVLLLDIFMVDFN